MVAQQRVAVARLVAGWSWGGAGGTSQVAVGVAVSYDHHDELADVIFHATGYSM